MAKQMRRHTLALFLVVLVGVPVTVAGSAITASPASAAREYDIGDGDTLLMLSPTEVKEYLNLLTLPPVNCNVVPGAGGGVLQTIAGKLSTLVGNANSVCGAYAKLRWVMNEQVRVAMQWAAYYGGCFPLVIDTAWWRGPKLRVAWDGSGQPVFSVQLGTATNFQNRGDPQHPILPILCTDYQPAQQVPLPDEIQHTENPPPAPATVPQSPLGDPYHDPDFPAPETTEPEVGTAPPSNNPIPGAPEVNS